jgi:hypothetical protein
LTGALENRGVASGDDTAIVLKGNASSMALRRADRNVDDAAQAEVTIDRAIAEIAN